MILFKVFIGSRRELDLMILLKVFIGSRRELDLMIFFQFSYEADVSWI